METKICCKCKIEKEKSEFSKDKNQKDGYTYSCKLCRNEKYKEWVKNNPDKMIKVKENSKIRSNKYYHSDVGQISYRKSHLKNNFGMSIEEFDIILEKQNNVCAICNNPETMIKNTFLSVDHCHETKINRGLLCSNCNRGIGLLKDNVEILKNAINYLITYKKQTNHGI